MSNPWFNLSSDNPNNVAAEASPYTTSVEKAVGIQLCKMVGINVEDKSKPQGWGHITSCGSVANLESVWAGNVIFPSDTFTITVSPVSS